VVESCSIIVTEANAVLAPIHDRMPVIISSTDDDTWLNPDLQDPETVNNFLLPYPAAEMLAYPVNRRMNNPRYTAADGIQPLS